MAVTVPKHSLFLAFCYVVWFAASAVCNVFCRNFLRPPDLAFQEDFSAPWTLTLCQAIAGFFACGSALLWRKQKLYSAQKSKKQLFASTTAVSSRQLDIQCAYIGFFHALGNYMTNYSMSQVAVSFTHTIKASEPLFSVGLGRVFLHKPVPFPVFCTLIPIIAGVALASFTEFTFTFVGFVTAMSSNLLFGLRNVTSKRMFEHKSMEGVELYFHMSKWGVILTIPLWLFLEAPKFYQVLSQQVATETVFSPTKLFFNLWAASLTHYLYNHLSYIILANVSNTTHAVSNVVKRVIVIVSSVLFFSVFNISGDSKGGPPFHFKNMFGVLLVIGGVASYSYVTMHLQRQQQRQQLQKYHQAQEQHSGRTPEGMKLP